LLRNGTTSALVFCAVYPQSVDALFAEAERRGMRIAAGKVLMDRNAPEALRDTAQRGYDESKDLIARWHGRGRSRYAITPRFAGTSTPAQLDAAGTLWREHKDVLLTPTSPRTCARSRGPPGCFPSGRISRRLRSSCG
jgi:guanine deaminase